MGLIRQAHMFASSQQHCLNCAQSFLPFSKDMIRVWDMDLQEEEDWLTSRNWAIDRLYQDNLKYCSPNCIEAAYLRHQTFLIAENWEKLKRKYR